MILFVTAIVVRRQPKYERRQHVYRSKSVIRLSEHFYGDKCLSSSIKLIDWFQINQTLNACTHRVPVLSRNQAVHIIIIL